MESECEGPELLLAKDGSPADQLISENFACIFELIAPLNLAALKAGLESASQCSHHFSVEFLSPVVIYETAAASSNSGRGLHHVFIAIISDAESVDSVPIWIGRGLLRHQVGRIHHTVCKQEDPLLAVEFERLRGFQRIQDISATVVSLERADLGDGLFHIVVVVGDDLLAIYLHEAVPASEADNAKLRADWETSHEEFQRLDCNHDSVVDRHGAAPVNDEDKQEVLAV